jgi:hypothetical protein
VRLSYIGALVAFTPIVAVAQVIEIIPGDCRSGVQLVARQVRLVDVLKRLARTLDFELRFEGDEGRIVNMNTKRQPVELIASLSPQDSIIVTQAKDAECPGRNRVVKVWVLPSTKQPAVRESPAAPATRPAQDAASPRPVPREQVIRGSRELEEQSRRAKALYDEYVRIHGVPPPGVEEEAAKP